MIPLISSVASMGGRYDAWFCDIWGVMHNGRDGFEGAIDACRRFRAEGGPGGTGGIVVLITNAPRPAYSVAEQLVDFGVPEDCYDAIVSSGDVAQHLIRENSEKGIFHLGPARDYPMIAQAGIQPVSFEAAEVMLVTGLLDDDVEGPEDYREMLQAAAKRGLTLICANPDLMVERGDRLVYCAGALAQLYRELGGKVLYAGKPYGPIYELAMQVLGDCHRDRKGDKPASERRNVLCIGDGMKTDMPGAFDAGFDALFVASGLHASNGLDERELQALFQGLDGAPVAAMTQLRWD